MLKAQEIRRPATKKVITTAAKQTKSFREQKLTIGLDLGDRSSWYCVLDERGSALLEQRLNTTPKAMREGFDAMTRCRIALETGMALKMGQPEQELSRNESLFRRLQIALDGVLQTGRIENCARLQDLTSHS